MIKGHKFFHSTSFPDKTNDLIFLKSKKKKTIVVHFCQFFGHFCQVDFSKRNWTLLCTSPYGPLTLYKVSEKIDVPIPRKLPKRRTDR